MNVLRSGCVCSYTYTVANGTGSFRVRYRREKKSLTCTLYTTNLLILAGNIIYPTTTTCTLYSVLSSALLQVQWQRSEGKLHNCRRYSHTTRAVQRRIRSTSGSPACLCVLLGCAGMPDLHPLALWMLVWSMIDVPLNSYQ